MNTTTYLIKQDLDFSKNLAQFIERPRTNEELVDCIKEMQVFLEFHVEQLEQIDTCYRKIMELLCKLS